MRIPQENIFKVLFQEICKLFLMQPTFPCYISTHFIWSGKCLYIDSLNIFQKKAAHILDRLKF